MSRNSGKYYFRVHQEGVYGPRHCLRGIAEKAIRPKSASVSTDLTANTDYTVMMKDAARGCVNLRSSSTVSGFHNA